MANRVVIADVAYNSNLQARTDAEFIAIRIDHAKIPEAALEILRRRLCLDAFAGKLRIPGVHVIDVEKNQAVRLTVSRVLRKVCGGCPWRAVALGLGLCPQDERVRERGRDRAFPSPSDAPHLRADRRRIFGEHRRDAGCAGAQESGHHSRLRAADRRQARQVWRRDRQANETVGSTSQEDEHAGETTAGQLRGAHSTGRQ